MEAATAKFRFNSYKVTKTEININPNIVKPGKLSVHFDTEGQPIRDSNKYQLAITTAINDNQDNVSIKVRVEADFEYDNIREEILEEMFTSNGPIILFPYIRAYISSVTALSGIAPITMPTFNFSKVSRIMK